MRRKRTRQSGSGPIMRFRSMLLGITIIAGLIAGPLLMVWKQVYITSTSVRMERMTDSLSVFTKEIATLRLKCERLSSNERIEKIARKKLHLEYPTSQQIVIIKVPEKERIFSASWPQELLAFFRKSLLKDRG